MANRGGRKSKYNPETVAKVIEALEKGVTIADACEYAGIGQSTYYEWAASKLEFAEATQKAIAKATLRLVDIVNEAAPQTWQAAAWLLERRLPERWGRRVVQHEGNADKPLKIEVVWGAMDAQSSDDTD